MLQSRREVNGWRKQCYLWNSEAHCLKINLHKMTYWKLLILLLLINASFSMGTESVWEKDRERKTNFCLIQCHWVTSCKALCLPLGSVFLLDILSLMNCDSSHLRSHRGSLPLPGHTHPSSVANQLAPVVQHPSHSENHSCHRSSSAGIFVCVLPSLISDHTHLFTCDRQPLPLGLGPVPPPLPSSAPPWDICVLWGKWAGKLGELQSRLLEQNKGAPTAEL